MKEIDMYYTFIKCAKRFISDIDEEELDWQLRTHQCNFDDSGPDVALPLRPNPPAKHAVGHGFPFYGSLPAFYGPPPRKT